MEVNKHGITELFDQLGLPSSDADIQAFISAHRPLSPEVRLSEAPFWSSTQAAFLRDGIKADADWAVVVDKLDASLR